MCWLLDALSPTHMSPAEVTHMSRAEVIETANHAATEAGYRLGDYGVPEAPYQFTKKNKTWTVFYKMKSPTPPGGHFLVWIEDETGNTQIMKGE